MRLLSQLSLQCHVVSPQAPDKSFPDFKQEAHWDCTGEFCLKAGTDMTGLVLILMISGQCTYTCLHHNTPFHETISHILIFVRFPDFL